MKSSCCDGSLKPKRYLQFNNLVFTGVKSVEDQSESVSFRLNKVDRTFSNGSYVANRGDKLLIDNNSISFTLALNTNTWDDDNIRVHYDFIRDQLYTPGKLWAINPGNQLVWCHAYCTSISDNKEWKITDDGYLIFKVEFDNPNGVWYKAREDHVFLEDFSLCDFTQLKTDCIAQTRYCCNSEVLCNQHCECCENDCKGMCDMVSLCEAYDDPDWCKHFFDNCETTWKINYNCEKAKLDGKELSSSYAVTVCDSCLNHVLQNSFLGDTLYPSSRWSIALMGNFENPKITLNNRDITIKGEYNGVLTINYKGQIHFASSWECVEYAYTEIGLDKLSMCYGSPSVINGVNQVAVTGVKSESACIYIDYERITS